MRKIFTSMMALVIGVTAFAQEEPTQPQEGKYYTLVTGYAAANDRKNQVFGKKTINNVEFYALQQPNAEDLSQQWTFVAKPAAEGDSVTVYALVNKNKEYVPMLGTIYAVNNGAVYQDTRFEVKSYEDSIPAEAYGFTLTTGTLTAAQAAVYNAHDLKEGDTYVGIIPLKYRCSKNNATSEEYVVDNVTGNNPVDPADGSINAAGHAAPYYLNAGGNGRQYCVNLWGAEAAPANSEYWMLVEIAEPIAPEVPTMSCTPEVVDSVINVPADSVAVITLTAEADAKIAYMFVAEGAEESGEYTELDENPAELTIDKSGVLTYKAVRDGLESEPASIEIKVAKTEEPGGEEPGGEEPGGEEPGGEEPGGEEPGGEEPGETPEEPGDIAGIKEITVGSAVKVYDLQGRLVKNVKSGLYIVNGQKVIVK